ncbi:MAG: DMT family transporter [Rhizobiaceae bacterium]|nr:DMT family transporter [Rhizobiaceae bacterium]
MAIAMAAFTVNDTMTKWLSTEMNMGQVMVMRGLIASLLIASIAWHRGDLARPLLALHPLVVLRSAAELCATVTFLLALAHLPIGNVSSVLQALPLAVTMGAALFLGEPVGWRRWLSIAVGFCGVVIIIRPGFAGFSVYSLYALASVACCVVRDLATRRLPHHIPAMLVSTVTAVLVAFCGIFLIEPMGGWRPLDAQNTTVLVAAAVLLVIGYHHIIKAMRTGDISFIAPFRYTSLLWALILGYAVFGDLPDLPMLAGAVIIVGSGLYMLMRERRVAPNLPAARSTSPSMAPDGL